MPTDEFIITGRVNKRQTPELQEIPPHDENYRNFVRALLKPLTR